MRGVNKVILIGNAGKDPETRFLPNGDAVTNLQLATSETWKDKNTGQQQERTEWNRVVFFKRLAEIAGEYIKKGSKVYVEGKLVTRKWQDKEGKDQYSTEVHAAEMQLLDGKGQQKEQQPAQAKQADAAQQPVQSVGGDDFDFSDDIPF